MKKLTPMRSCRDFIRDDSGATAIEYAIVAAVMGLGTALQAKYQSVSDALN